VRRPQTEGPVGAVAVVLGHVDAQHMEKMTLAEDQQAIQAFTAGTRDEAFHGGVRRRCLARLVHGPDARASQELTEGVGELGIAVVDEEATLLAPIVKIHEQVARLLADPGAGGVGRDRDILARGESQAKEGPARK